MRALAFALLLVSTSARADDLDDNPWFATHVEASAGVDATDEQVGRVLLHDRTLEAAIALVHHAHAIELAYAIGVADDNGTATTQHAALRVRHELFGVDENGYLVRRYAAWIEGGAGTEWLTGRDGAHEARPLVSLGIGFDADRSLDEDQADRRYLGARVGVRLLAAPGPRDARAALCLGPCSLPRASSIDLAVMVTAMVVVSP
jgi:hypothetical protein